MSERYYLWDCETTIQEEEVRLFGYSLAQGEFNRVIRITGDDYE